MVIVAESVRERALWQRLCKAGQESGSALTLLICVQAAPQHTNTDQQCESCARIVRSARATRCAHKHARQRLSLVVLGWVGGLDDAVDGALKCQAGHVLRRSRAVCRDDRRRCMYCMSSNTTSFPPATPCPVLPRPHSASAEPATCQARQQPHHPASLQRGCVLAHPQSAARIELVVCCRAAAVSRPDAAAVKAGDSRRGTRPLGAGPGS